MNQRSVRHQVTLAGFSLPFYFSEDVKESANRKLKKEQDQKISSSKLINNSTKNANSTLKVITWFLFFTVLSCFLLSITLFTESGVNSFKIPEYMTSENLAKGFLQNAAPAESKNRFESKTEGVSTLITTQSTTTLTKHLNQKSPSVEVSGSH